eukprot:s2820_g1.t1
MPQPAAWLPGRQSYSTLQHDSSLWVFLLGRHSLHSAQRAEEPGPSLGLRLKNCPGVRRKATAFTACFRVQQMALRSMWEFLRNESGPFCGC